MLELEGAARARSAAEHRAAVHNDAFWQVCCVAATSIAGVRAGRVARQEALAAGSALDGLGETQVLLSQVRQLAGTGSNAGWVGLAEAMSAQLAAREECVSMTPEPELQGSGHRGRAQGGQGLQGVAPSQVLSQAEKWVSDGSGVVIANGLLVAFGVFAWQTLGENVAANLPSLFSYLSVALGVLLSLEQFSRRIQSDTHAGEDVT